VVAIELCLILRVPWLEISFFLNQVHGYVFACCLCYLLLMSELLSDIFLRIPKLFSVYVDFVDAVI
jgi:hypothetical protein